MNSIYARNVPSAYSEALVKMKMMYVEETSRNGPVYTVPDPVFLQIADPRQRVLFDATRDANPFFHVMEFVWMMTGSQDSTWISQFNKRFTDYADPGTTSIHGAYGYRWRKHFALDQLSVIIAMLKKDPSTRRCVISMWDSEVDLGASHNDLPCNTSIMFRYVEGELNMTVVNRSNDLIWGMLGANAVHMTMLHELVASAANLTLGAYQVFTNNLHFYPEMPKGKEIWNTFLCDDRYRGMEGVEPIHLLGRDEIYEDLIADCNLLVGLTDEDENPEFHTNWMRHTGHPIYKAWFTRDQADVRSVEALDWQLACREWLERRSTK